jgi:hypothetical protein
LCIAEIVCQFDVVAVQEVRESAQAFLLMMKALGEGWAFLVTDVTRGKEGNMERLFGGLDDDRLYGQKNDVSSTARRGPTNSTEGWGRTPAVMASHWSLAKRRGIQSCRRGDRIKVDRGHGGEGIPSRPFTCSASELRHGRQGSRGYTSFNGYWCLGCDLEGQLVEPPAHSPRKSRMALRVSSGASSGRK